MWQSARNASRSPWIQLLKDLMRRKQQASSASGKSTNQVVDDADLDAETEVLGESDSGCESSDGIPSSFFDPKMNPEYDGSQSPASGCPETNTLQVRWCTKPFTTDLNTESH